MTVSRCSLSCSLKQDAASLGIGSHLEIMPFLNDRHFHPPDKCFLIEGESS